MTTIDSFKISENDANRGVRRVCYYCDGDKCVNCYAFGVPCLNCKNMSLVKYTTMTWEEFRKYCDNDAFLANFGKIPKTYEEFLELQVLTRNFSELCITEIDLDLDYQEQYDRDRSNSVS